VTIIIRNQAIAARRVLEKTVDKRSEHGAVGKDQQGTEQQKKNQNRRDPPLFALAKKVEEFLNDRQFAHRWR
jgi:hypothetical protein